MSSELTPLLLLVILLVVFWLVVLRPARTQQRTQQALQRSLEVGEDVVLSSGIFGTVTDIDDTQVGLEIAPGTVIRVARQVVVRRVDDVSGPEGAADAGSADDADLTEATPADDRSLVRDDERPEIFASEPVGSEEAAATPLATDPEIAPHEVSAEDAPVTSSPVRKTATTKKTATKKSAKRTAAKKTAETKAGAGADDLSTADPVTDGPDQDAERG